MVPLAAAKADRPVALPGRCCLYARSIGTTALVATSAASLGLNIAGVLPGQVPWAALLPVCLMGLVAYCYELSSRHVWAIARSTLTGESFAACAEAMRDAAPLVELEVPGAAVVPYEVVQWRDETAWLECGMGPQQRLVLVFFPLEFIPGDHSEASALEYTCTQLAHECATAGSECAAAQGDDSPRHEDDALKQPTDPELRLRLRWPDGLETEEPPPRLLNSGPAGADWPCPGLLFLSCLCLLGLIADIVLIGLAEPVEWPIRKRFFTREGGRLGTLSFSCSATGLVEMEGDPQELRSKNRFWINDEAHWRALEEEVSGLGPDLIRFRWLRRIGQFCAVILGVAMGGRTLFFRREELATAPWVLVASALASAGLWGLGPLADWLARRRVQASSSRLGGMLPGGASVTASWVDEANLVCGDLAIQVQSEKPREGTDEQLPILRSTSNLSKSESPTLYYACTSRWGSAKVQPSVYRSQTV